MSMLTPFFVSTCHSVFNSFSYYKNDTKMPLTSFIDYLFTDESGQIPPDTGAIGFLLAKRAIVVGDIYQLPPIYTIPEKFEVLDKALYSYYLGEENSKDLNEQPFNCHSGSVMKIASNNSNFWEFDKLERGLYLLEHCIMLYPY